MFECTRSGVDALCLVDHLLDLLVLDAELVPARVAYGICDGLHLCVHSEMIRDRLAQLMVNGLHGCLQELLVVGELLGEVVHSTQKGPNLGIQVVHQCLDTTEGVLELNGPIASTALMTMLSVCTLAVTTETSSLMTLMMC